MAAPPQQTRTADVPDRQLELFAQAPPTREQSQSGQLVPIRRPRRTDDHARLTLGAAARIIREAVKDKSYRKTPVGQLVGRYLRWFRNEYGATESPSAITRRCLRA